MPKVNRQAGIHLHKTKVRVGSIKSNLATKELYEEQYYWILIAKNGKTIARSSETYKRKGSAVKSIVVATGIVLGRTPYTLIPYYDHTLEGTPKKHI